MEYNYKEVQKAIKGFYLDFDCDISYYYKKNKAKLIQNILNSDYNKNNVGFEEIFTFDISGLDNPLNFYDIDNNNISFVKSNNSLHFYDIFDKKYSYKEVLRDFFGNRLVRNGDIIKFKYGIHDVSVVKKMILNKKLNESLSENKKEKRIKI